MRRERPVVLLSEGRLVKLREELVEAIQRNRLRRGDLNAQRSTRRGVIDDEQPVILAFAERVLPRAADLWVQASLNQKQRLQQLFLPEGIAFDGNRFNRTAATAPFFKYLAPGEKREESLVSRRGIESTAADALRNRITPE